MVTRYLDVGISWIHNVEKTLTPDNAKKKKHKGQNSEREKNTIMDHGQEEQKQWRVTDVATLERG